MLKKYTIPVTWTMFGECHVIAESQEEAIEQVYASGSLPGDSTYLDDSLVIDSREIVEEEISDPEV